MRMNVVYISASNPISSIGGAANTASGWIDELLEHDVEVDVICRGKSDAAVVEDGVTVTQLSGRKPQQKIEERLEKGEYDVALIQDLWADIAFEAAAATDIPTVLSLTTTHAEADVVSEFSPTRFIANSQYTQQWITSIWGRDSAVVYPHIDFDFYTAPNGPSDAISMVNPIEMKGGTTFRTLAEQFPDRKFLAKGGWYSFRNDDFSWDLDTLLIQGSTFHGVPLDVPDEEIVKNGPTDVGFAGVENVTFTTEPGILDIYAKTKVLLVPSIWQETFGRVVLEAMWNGIPVVASHQGGLPEACGGAGLLVEDFTNPAAWAEKLEKLDDSNVYDGFAERGRERSEQYKESLPTQIDTLQRVLEDAAADQ
jgi:glycosyltransferase involved in cell wall biosynthesis